MSTKWQKIDVKLPKAYTPTERRAIGHVIVDYIRKRTVDQNVDKNGKPFPKYSEAYVKSLNFKIAGKSKNDVNLTQSGDLMGALDVLTDETGKVRVGYEKGTLENSIADGNIRGTYGNHRGSSTKARDFLGISAKELAAILKQFPLDDREKSKETAKKINSVVSAGQEPSVVTDGEEG